VRFFRKQNQGLEDRLRSLSAEPRDEFVRGLASEVRSRRVRTALRTRRGFAVALVSAALLIPFAAFGGVGYAKEAAKGAAQSVVQNDGGNGNKGNGNTGNNNKGNGNEGNNNTGNANVGDNNKGNGNGPDDDQYKPGKGCGDKNHQHERENECKKLKDD
jgi:hypothetical protein